MRILYVNAERIPVDGPSGASVHVTELTRHLTNRGHEVHMVWEEHYDDTRNSSDTSLSSFSGLRDLLPRWVKAIGRDLRVVADNLGLWSALLRTASRIEPDLVYERDAYLSFAGPALARHLRVPYVLECNGMFWEELPKLFGRPITSERACRKFHIAKANSADAVIAVSKTFKDMLTRLGVPRGTIHAVHNGVAFGHMYVDKSVVRQIRECYELEGRFVVGFVGSIVKWHGIDVLIDAAKIAKACSLPIYFMVVGGGRQEEYRQLATDAELDGYVGFTGPVLPDRVPSYVSVMDVGVIPGHSEYGSPVKLFQYGALGKVVVSVDMPAVREVLVDGVNGLLVRHRDPAQFAATIINVATDLERYLPLGRQLKLDVLSRYTWDRVAERVEEICLSVLCK